MFVKLEISSLMLEFEVSTDQLLEMKITSSFEKAISSVFTLPYCHLPLHGRQQNKTIGVLMFSGTLRHLFGAYAALLFLQIIAIHHSCSARKNSNYCSPSSCGNIHNISYPF
ncbi:hypothetical protein NC651_007623 [Populus alba x Populus x berolinensis]|nr:hypothetical protein NC651_007623 [Populus alba x Populus x berolinensis]